MATPRTGLVTFLILFFLLSGKLCGVPASVVSSVPGTFLFDSWKIEQGLPQISVFALAQDQPGYLWFGTEEGLVRFDGQRFDVLDRSNTPELRSPFIQALLPDPDGSLWIGTQHGLGHLENGQLTLYTTADGLADLDVMALYRDRQSQLWVGTASGLSRLEGESFVSAAARPGELLGSVQAIQEDFEGDLWLGTSTGLKRLRKEQNEIVPGPVTADADLSRTMVHSLAIDRSGRLWVGTAEGLYSLESGEITAYTIREGLPHSTVRALYLDSADSLWIGTESGLSHLLPDRAGAGIQEIYTRDDGLTDNWISSLWEDHEGTLWVGTRFGGLNRMRRAPIRSFGTSQGLVHDLVWGIHQDRAGNVWVATDGGLSQLRPDGSVANYTSQDGLPDPATGALYEDSKGHLWVGTFEHGLLRFDGETFDLYTAEDGFPPVRVRRLIEDAAGRLFIATNSGLIERTEEGFKIWAVEDGLPHAHIRDLHADPQGGLWLATDGGLVRFRDGEFVTFPTDQDVLTDERFKTIYGDDEGVLWLGTWERGLARFKDGQFTFISVEDGLHHHRIHRILEDEDGGLWMSSNRGVFRVGKNDLNEFAGGRRAEVTSLAYDENDGMRSRECNGGAQPAGIRSQDGRLWFATIAGVAVVDPRNLMANHVPPPVYIENIQIDRQPFVPPPDPSPQRVEFPARTREFEFHSVALSFLAPEKNRFKYKLEGFDRDWVDASGRRAAYYTNLAPGSYRFRTIAANNDGVWNEVGDSFEFFLRPAFYQTWTFFFGILVVALTGTWGLHRMRVRSVLQQKIEHNRIQLLEAKNAEMEHFTRSVSHDLKTPLFTVEGFLGFLEQDLARDRPEKIPEHIKKIRTAVGRMGRLLDTLLELSHSGRVVNDPQQVRMGELAGEAVDLAAGLIAERGVEIHVAPNLPTAEGDPHRLLQVLQNLITNAVKFMGAEQQPQVEIGTRHLGQDPESAELVFYVRDNGVGIKSEDQEKVFGLFDKLDPEVEGSGIGLALVRRIIEAHGGRIWVVSEGPEKGATFFFTLPVTQDEDLLL